MQNKYLSIIKTGLVLGVSYIFTVAVIYVFFPDNSPQINTSNVQYLAQTVKDEPHQFLVLLSKMIKLPTNNSSVNIQTIDTNSMVSFQSVSKGVYAKEENGTIVTVIKQDEMDAIQYAFMVEGKPVNIRVPANVASKEDIQKMLNEMKNYKKAN